MNLRSSTRLAIVLLLVCGCQKKMAPKHEPQGFRMTGAAELFDLESKCNFMGQKVLENKAMGPTVSQSQVSHYNSADNRCYVQLRSAENGLSSRSLFDGQTGEELASIYCKDRWKCSADVTDESLKHMVKDPDTPSEFEVQNLMDKFVHADRNPQREDTP
jgi:hypothetical protein